MTLIQTNLTSNLPSVTRVDLIARQNPTPKRGVAEYGEAAGQMERALLRAMLEAAKPKGAAVRAASKQTKAARLQKLRASDVESRLVAAIGAPKTAAQIAAEIGASCSTVKTRLRKMALAGSIEALAQPRHKSGQNRPFLYAALGTFAKPYDFSESKPAPLKPAVRDAVLALLSKPHAAFQVSNALGINRQKARYQIQCFAADGLIRPAGTADTFRAKGIQTWVRA